MNKTHNYPLLITLALACHSAFPTSGKSAVLFSDNFTGVAASAGGGVSTGLNAAGWYFNGSSGGDVWTTGTDNTSPLSGAVMKNPGGPSTWQYGLKQFSNTTLSTIGDSLTFTMDYHMGVDTDSNNVGISILNSPTSVIGNLFGAWPANNSLSAANGYSVLQLSKTTATNAAFSKTVNGVDIFSGTALGTTSGTAILGVTSTAHTIVFSLSKVALGTKLTWSIDGTELGNYTDATYSIFNTVRLFSGGNTPVYMDNISVASIPEPSTAAMLLAAGGLSLLWIRRRA